MEPKHSLIPIIEDQTKRALWEVKKVIHSIPEDLWNKTYCEMPMWKHVYHMLHSLDLWFINPRDSLFTEPDFHEKDLNNLDVISVISLSRAEINQYFTNIEQKICVYLLILTDDSLLQNPPGCEYCVFTLILAQFRHLHSHMGMIMGFLIDDAGIWPEVLGLEGSFPEN